MTRTRVTVTGMTLRKPTLASATLFVMLATLTPLPAAGQDPCMEVGTDCRVMSSAETKGFKERMAALQAALPVPDSTRYVRSSLGSFVDAMTTPAIAMMEAPGAPAGELMICRSWRAGCFPTETDLWFTYSRKEEKAKTEEETKDLFSLAKGMMSEMENRVEVNAWLRPHPHLVGNLDGKCVDVEDETATAIEKTPTFLSYQTGDESCTTLHLIFGPRTCQEEDTLNVEQPAKNLAPVVSVELLVSGPPAEVADLQKKINRKAYEALLGAVVK